MPHHDDIAQGRIKTLVRKVIQQGINRLE